MRLAVGPLLGFALLATLGCAIASFDLTGKERALEDAQRRYTELVRWGEIEGASAYVDPAVATDYLNIAERFRDIRFSDFETGPLQFGEGSDTATVDVVYHAYSIRTLVEKRIREHQEWYREASAANAWRVRPNLDAIASELNGSR
ncbi:MAG: hypothetical protein IH827_11845 [Myxococcales bacterium]|nr:hypothetical protein [Myxococcales bacterium]